MYLLAGRRHRCADADNDAGVSEQTRGVQHRHAHALQGRQPPRCADLRRRANAESTLPTTLELDLTKSVRIYPGRTKRQHGPSLQLGSTMLTSFRASSAAMG